MQGREDASKRKVRFIAYLKRIYSYQSINHHLITSGQRNYNSILVIPRTGLPSPSPPPPLSTEIHVINGWGDLNLVMACNIHNINEQLETEQ